MHCSRHQLLLPATHTASKNVVSNWLNESRCVITCGSAKSFMSGGAPLCDAAAASAGGLLHGGSPGVHLPDLSGLAPLVTTLPACSVPVVVVPPAHRHTPDNSVKPSLQPQKLETWCDALVKSPPRDTALVFKRCSVVSKGAVPQMGMVAYIGIEWRRADLWHVCASAASLSPAHNSSTSAHLCRLMLKRSTNCESARTSALDDAVKIFCVLGSLLARPLVLVRPPSALGRPPSGLPPRRRCPGPTAPPRSSPRRSHWPR